MRKDGILHPELAFFLASLGHLDRFCVADAGLPIPEGVPRIDLAYAPGKPPFLDVLTAVIDEISVEKVLWAREARGEVGECLREFFSETPALTVEHEELKEMLPQMRFIIRTGEFTPYSNVVITCGVPF